MNIYTRGTIGSRMRDGCISLESKMIIPSMEAELRSSLL